MDKRQRHSEGHGERHGTGSDGPSRCIANGNGECQEQDDDERGNGGCDGRHDHGNERRSRAGREDRCHAKQYGEPTHHAATSNHEDGRASDQNGTASEGSDKDSPLEPGARFERVPKRKHRARPSAPRTRATQPASIASTNAVAMTESRPSFIVRIYLSTRPP